MSENVNSVNVHRLNDKTAFPISVSEGQLMAPGMTLREYYAGLIVQAMITKGWWSTKDGKRRYAEAAFEYADAMIKEGLKYDK